MIRKWIFWVLLLISILPITIKANDDEDWFLLQIINEETATWMFVSVETGEQIPLRQDLQDLEITSVSWSSARNALAFTNTDVWLIDETMSRPRRILGTEGSGYTAIYSAVWSNEGDWLFMASRIHSERQFILPDLPINDYVISAERIVGELFAYNFETRSWRRIFYTPRWFGYNGDGVWSPDDQQIAFTHGVFGSSYISIVGSECMQPFYINCSYRVVSTDILPPEKEPSLGGAENYWEQPQWTLDGKNLMFWCVDAICVMNADGTELIETIETPGWGKLSRYGSYFLYESTEYDPNALVKYDLETGEETVILEGVEWREPIVWVDMPEASFLLDE